MDRCSLAESFFDTGTTIVRLTLAQELFDNHPNSEKNTTNQGKQPSEEDAAGCRSIQRV